MREDLFDYVPPYSGGLRHSSCVGYTCNHCGMANDVSVPNLRPANGAGRPRRGNLFSQYTRKFSLGNGPADWVQEYLISKEGGKMLGTLIALTIANMPNLETLIWDMPTGVVREVWHALASLGQRRPGYQSRLEKVWVRLHDNREVIASLPANPNSTSSTPAVPVPSSSANTAASETLGTVDLSYKRVEHPNFSILPALKSFSVLEVDELAYLEEISILICNSRDSLRELRIGLSNYFASIVAQLTATSDTPELHRRAVDCYNDGGVLGLVMKDIHDCRKPIKAPTVVTEVPTEAKALLEEAQAAASMKLNSLFTLPFSTISVSDAISNVAASVALPDSSEEGDADRFEDKTIQTASLVGDVPAPTLPVLPPSLFSSAPIGDPLKQAQRAPQPPGLQVVNPSYGESAPSLAGNACAGQEWTTCTAHSGEEVHRQRRPLRLETFELEKVPLSVNVLQQTIDWSVLTSLTLLDCGDHERLWKSLRRTYSPRSTSLIGASSLGALARQSRNSSFMRASSSKLDTTSAPEYRLKLKRIHTDNVSHALISFLKESLAPNTLEWMLLQEHGQYISPVTVEAIYRGPLRYHRSSLKKVLIDSSDLITERGRSTKWKKWMLNHDILTFITSGKMSCLRELGMSLDHRDWVRKTPLACFWIEINFDIALFSSTATQYPASSLSLHPAYCQPRLQPSFGGQRTGSAARRPRHRSTTRDRALLHGYPFEVF